MSEANAPPPNKLTPSNLPEWINAIAAVGMLLIGIVGVSATMRVNGIEEYLQSEIAVRNRQVMQAEDRVDVANGENENLRRERARLAEDVSISQRQLTYNEFASAVSRMGSTVAYDGLFAEYENPPRALPALSTNPGADLLARVLDHYSDSANPHERTLVRQLRSRCAARMNTPLQFAEIEAALLRPEMSETGSRTENLARYNTALAEWRRSRETFSQAAQARMRAVGEAHSTASRELRACALDILNNR